MYWSGKKLFNKGVQSMIEIIIGVIYGLFMFAAGVIIEKARQDEKEAKTISDEVRK